MDRQFVELAKHQLIQWDLRTSLELWEPGSPPYVLTQQLIDVHESYLKNFSMHKPDAFKAVRQAAEELRKGRPYRNEY